MKEYCHSIHKPTSMRKFIHRLRRRKQQERCCHDQKQELSEYWTTDKEEDLVCDNVDNLSSKIPTEIHLKILSFLDIQSLNNMMATSHTWYSFLQSSDAQHWLWWRHCQRIWNLEANYYASDGDEDLWNLNLIDDLKSDDRVSNDDDKQQQQERQVPNLLGLLAKTPMQKPLLPTTMNPFFGRTSPLKAFEDGNILTLRIIHDYISHQAFSARADYPLTRPSTTTKTNHSRRSTSNNLMAMCLEKCRRIFRKKHPEWNAFVSPYSIFGEPLSTIHVTPRLVSYFEITVEEATHTTPELLQRRLISNHPSSWIQDCVVIGLAPIEFDSRMDLPGWDGDSFGYHGDTGGLYHGGFYEIGITHENTEPFGTGDTVGMGIDYVQRGVFVTKNGRLLGFFFARLQVEYLASTDLYPVVGMDSQDTVVVNYGGYGKPFLFDLANYCQIQQQELPPKRRIPRTP